MKRPIGSQEEKSSEDENDDSVAYNHADANDQPQPSTLNHEDENEQPGASNLEDENNQPASSNHEDENDHSVASNNEDQSATSDADYQPSDSTSDDNSCDEIHSPVPNETKRKKENSQRKEKYSKNSGNVDASSINDPPAVETIVPSTSVVSKKKKITKKRTKKVSSDVILPTISKEKTKNKRVFDKRHCCLFCQTFHYHIVRHYERCHKVRA